MPARGNDFDGILDELHKVWPFLGEQERDDLQLQAEIDSVLDEMERHNRRLWVEQLQLMLPTIVGPE